MHRGTILVVDNDPELGFFLSAVLQARGFNVVVAPDGEQGLMEARQANPALICLDTNMPHSSGLVMYRALKQDPVLKSVPVIVVTRTPDELDVLLTPRAAPCGSDVCIIKPFVPPMVLATIEQVLRGHLHAN